MGPCGGRGGLPPRLRSRAIVHLAFSGDGSTLAATDGQSAVVLLDLSALRRQLSDIGLEW